MVTLADPVGALFDCRTTLAVPPSPEKPRVTLPPDPAIVSDARLLPCTTDPPWHLTELSDPHAVCSHAVAPTLDPALYPSRPRLLPAIVTLVDPLAPRLLRRVTLTAPIFIECARDVLPTRWPIVTIARPLPIAPCECKLRTELSDSQLVRSQLVIPTLTAPQYPVKPIPIPCIVTLIEPVAAALGRLKLLVTAPDIDIARLKLPTLSPDVNSTIRLLAATSWLDPHRTDVSDCQALLSQADRPTLPAVVYASNPILDPYRVTLTDPEEATLLPDITLSPTSSAETPFEALPRRDPAVTSARRLPATACPTRHCMHVSDTQPDCSHDVPPTRALALLAVSPPLAPSKVTIEDPVTPPFPRNITLIAAESKHCAEVMLPARPPAVSDASRLRITPCPDWHRKDESESHAVPSQAVLPCTSPAVYAPSPRLLPCIVTLIEPVAKRFARRVLLAFTTSTDSPRLTLPNREPVVIPSRRLATTPPAVRHARLVSDNQILRSQLECLIRTASDAIDVPKLPPCNVTIVDPVALPFVRLTPLSPGLSAENARDRLPTRAASEAVTIRVALAS